MRECWQVPGRRRGDNSPCHLRILYLGVKHSACTAWLAIPCFCRATLWFSYSCWEGQWLTVSHLVYCPFGCRRYTGYLCNQGVFGVSWRKNVRTWGVVFSYGAEPLKLWRLSWIFNCSQQKMFLELSCQHTRIQIINTWTVKYFLWLKLLIYGQILYHSFNASKWVCWL